MNTSHLMQSQPSFKEFLFHNRRNKLKLYLAAAAIIIQFAVFKYLYPYANYVHEDSFIFLNAAVKNLTTDYFPIGYSKFLRLINLFAKPDWALVIVQYLMIEASVLFLLFTIYYFLRPGQLTQWILLAFMTVNPLLLHLANLVTNDGLFLALSLTWLTLVMWLIHRPTTRIIIWHALVLVIAFTVSYTALIYPLIAALAFRLSSLSLRKKLAGLGLGWLLCGSFVIFTIVQNNRLTGHWQYSPYNSWLIANNALFAYKEVKKVDRLPVAPAYQALDSKVRNNFDWMGTMMAYYPPPGIYWERTYYMWEPMMPLMQYRDSVLKITDTNASDWKKWASMGSLYNGYGWNLIRHYPLQYAKQVLGWNVKKYFAPPVEALEKYNAGQRRATEEAKNWFGYTRLRIKTRLYEPEITALNFYPMFSGIMNAVFVFALLYYLFLKGWKHNTAFNKNVLLGSMLWLLNTVYIICTTSTSLRVQSFPLLLTTTLALLLVDWLVKLIGKIKLEQDKQIKLEANFSKEAMA